MRSKRSTNAAVALVGATLLARLPLAVADDEGAPDLAHAVDWTRVRAHALANNPEVKAAPMVGGVITSFALEGKSVEAIEAIRDTDGGAP